MSDTREALVAHLERVGMGYGLHDGLKREVLAAWADAILAEFDVTPRGEVMADLPGFEGTRTALDGLSIKPPVYGTTDYVGMGRDTARRTASLLDGAPTALPPIEDLTRAMHAEVCCPCDPTGCDVQYVPEVRYARAVLALLPGRAEAEVRAEAAESLRGWVADTPHMAGKGYVLAAADKIEGKEARRG